MASVFWWATILAGVKVQSWAHPLAGKVDLLQLQIECDQAQDLLFLGLEAPVDHERSHRAPRPLSVFPLQPAVEP